MVHRHKVLFAVAAIVLLTAVNLRGIRESGLRSAAPPTRSWSASW